MNVPEVPGDIITITNYVNPQLFWYLNIKKLENCAKELKQTEYEIQKYYNGNLQNRCTAGDLVVLNYLPIRKLIRGRVVEVHQSNPNICTVWAIDYGFPIESSCEHVSSLPKKFEKPFGHIDCGGVGYVKLRDDIPTWQTTSCFESVLKGAELLHFTKMFETLEGQSFGHLYIVEKSKLYSAAEFLISFKLAIPSPDFESICSILPTTQYGSWRSVCGKSLAILNCSLVQDFKCKTVSDLVDRYTMQFEVNNSLARVKCFDNNSTIPFENNSMIPNGIGAKADISKLVFSENHRTHLPFDNGYSRYRQRIAALKDPSLQQEKIDEILHVFGGDCTNVLQNPFRKLDRLLHKQTYANGISKTMDSAAESPTCAIKTDGTNTNPKETKYALDYLKTNKIGALNDDEIAKKPKDDLPPNDAPTRSIDKERNKIESAMKEMNGIPLKDVSIRSIDKEINKMESKMKEINGIPLKDVSIKSIDKEINKMESKMEEINGIPLKDVSIKSIDKEINKMESKMKDINVISKQHSGNENQKTANIEINNCNNNEKRSDDLCIRAALELEKLSKQPNYIGEMTNGLGNRNQYGQNGLNKNSISPISKTVSIGASTTKLKVIENKGQTTTIKSSNYGNIGSGKKRIPETSLIDKSVTTKTCVTEETANYQMPYEATDAINRPKTSNYSIGIGDIANAISSVNKPLNNLPESNRTCNKRWPRHKNEKKNYGNVGTGTDIRKPIKNDCNPPQTTITKDNDNSIAKTKITNNQKSTEPLDSVENIEKINKIINEMSPVDETIKKNKTPVHGERLLQVNFMNHMVLAHANVPIIPVGNFDHVDFQPNVRRVMKERRIDKILEIQKLAWPHLLHGNQSLILISQHKSGRTWCYLPALCSQVEKQTNLELKKKQSNKQVFGPMAIILVADNKEAQNVRFTCETLLKNDISQAPQVVAAYAGQNIANLRISMHNACKILVTTTPQLEELFKYDAAENIFSPDRLSFLVIDDLDLITTHNGQKFQKLFGNLLKLCKSPKSSQSLKPQLVLTSTHWQPNYMKFCWKEAKTPLLIFGDFLEAAVFAETRLILKMIDTNDDKLQRVIDFLEYRTCNGHTIIYCKECSEVLTLQSKLEMANYECLAYIKTSSIEDQENIKKWQSHPTKKILILSDECPELKIVQNAKYLLHYTFAKTWIKFTRRFISVTKRFYSAAATNDLTNVNESKNNKRKIYIAMVLLDQKDEMWLPQIQNFMEKHNIKASQPLVSLVKKSKSKLEEERAFIGLTLCPMLLTYGVCDEYRCIYRHELTKMDMVPEDRKDEIPVDGDITIEVLKVYNPAHFAAIVVKHQHPGSSKSWRELPNKENHNSLSFKLIMHYSVEENNKMHWPPMQHDICVIKVGGQYQRVRILKVGQMENRNTLQPDVYVEVQVMDNNTDILQRKAGALLHCPLEFQKVPAMAIDVRHTGFVPFNGDRTWLPNATKMISEELETIRNSKNLELFAQIDFTTSHTIFIKNIYVLENLVTVKTKTFRNLESFQLLKDVAHKDEKIVSKVRNIFNDFIKNENDNILSATEESFNDSFESALTSFSQNKISDDYEVANAVEISSSESNDFNNISANSIDLTNIKMDPPERKQPESWCTLPINELTKIQIGSQQDDESWNGFYIIRKNNEFKNILKRIEDYMLKKPPPLTSIKQFKSGHNFIIKHDNNIFVRAKLVAVYESSNKLTLYQFLLVDLGNIIYLADSAIKRDAIIYESSNELDCAKIPYQTIYCKLAGIVMRSNQKYIKVKGKHIYVVAKRQYESSSVKDIGIQGYEVILYECDYEDDLSGGLMFNKHLIDSDAADYDNQTKTDLDMDITKNMDPNKSVKLLEQCLQNMMDFEKDSTKDFFKQLFGIYQNNGDECESTAKPNKSTQNKEKERCDIKDDMNKQLSTKNNSRSRIKPIVSETVYPTKYPQVTWYQNSAFINISIEIPEATNYVVDCNGSELFYATEPSDDEPISQLFHIYLCGYVKQVTHEKRGLHVFIKLRKVMCALWPNLVEVTDNDPSFQLPYIKYNLDHVEIGSEELSHVQETQLALSRIEAGLYKNSSLDKDYMEDNSEVDSDNGPECEFNEYFIQNKF